MNTAGFSARGGVVTKIASHTTGHQWAKDGTLLRVDYERGLGWIARHYDRNLRVLQHVRGSDEEAHRAAARWAQD
jgi:hypothetical protein